MYCFVSQYIALKLILEGKGKRHSLNIWAPAAVCDELAVRTCCTHQHTDKLLYNCHVLLRLAILSTSLTNVIALNQKAVSHNAGSPSSSLFPLISFLEPSVPDVQSVRSLNSEKNRWGKGIKMMKSAHFRNEE